MTLEELARWYDGCAACPWITGEAARRHAAAAAACRELAARRDSDDREPYDGRYTDITDAAIAACGTIQ